MNFLRSKKAEAMRLSLPVLRRQSRTLGLKGKPAKIYFEVERTRTTGVAKAGNRTEGVEKYTSSYVFDPANGSVLELREKRRPGGLHYRDCATAEEWIESFFFYVNHGFDSITGASLVEADGLFERFLAGSLAEAEFQVRMDLEGIDFSSAFESQAKGAGVSRLGSDKTETVIQAALMALRLAWEDSHC